MTTKDFTLLRPWLAEGRRHPREPGQAEDCVVVLPTVRVERGDSIPTPPGIDDSDTERANAHLASKRRHAIGKSCSACVGTGRGSATDPDMACATCEGVGVVPNDEAGPDRCYTPTPPRADVKRGPLARDLRRAERCLRFLRRAHERDLAGLPLEKRTVDIAYLEAVCSLVFKALQEYGTGLGRDKTVSGS